MATNKSDIINKILKLKRLAEQGSEGERSNAEKLLNELMKKYCITEKDLAQDDNEENPHYFCSEGNKWLLVQIAAYVIGFNTIRGGKISDIIPKPVWKNTVRLDKSLKDCDYVFLCTTAQMLEINTLFQIYLYDYKKSESSLQYAFLSKNELLAPVSSDHAKKEEIDMMQISIFSDAIQKKHIYKELQAKQ